MADGTHNAVVITYQRGGGHLWWHRNQPGMSIEEAITTARDLDRNPINLGEVNFVAEAGMIPPVSPDSIACTRCRERIK